jgi:hypothetical protein
LLKNLPLLRNLPPKRKRRLNPLLKNPPLLKNLQPRQKHLLKNLLQQMSQPKLTTALRRNLITAV